MPGLAPHDDAPPHENGHTNESPPTTKDAWVELVDAINDKLFASMAECVAWLSDYEVLPDKSLNDDFFKR